MASLSPDSTNRGADPGQMFVARDPELFLGRVFADALGAMTLFFCVISSPLASDRCLFFLCHCLQTRPRLLNLSQLFSPPPPFFFYLLCCVGAGGSPAARTPTPELRENLESSHAFFFFFFSFQIRWLKCEISITQTHRVAQRRGRRPARIPLSREPRCGLGHRCTLIFFARRRESINSSLC